MVTERDWAEGFLAQARADLEAARVLITQNAITASGASVFSMLLQMAFEKFAKAALLRSGAIAYSGAKSSHKGASTMVAAMRLQKNLIAPIGGPHVWTAAFEVIEALERAQPSLAKAHGGPQLEYPWASVAGLVLWPARDLPIANRLSNPSSRLVFHVLDFAERLNREFDAIFP
jgi:hypothetical protein